MNSVRKNYKNLRHFQRPKALGGLQQQFGAHHFASYAFHIPVVPAQTKIREEATLQILLQ